MKTTFYTGVGDSGASAIGKRTRSKDDPIFMLLGSLDECTSWLGLAIVSSETERSLKETSTWLHILQEYLFIAQAEVAAIAFDYGSYTDEKTNSFPKITKKHLSMCEDIIKVIDDELPTLKHFILPGGSEVAAHCDIARTIARKAERYAIVVSRKNLFAPELLAFLNRLSSVLFAVARYVNFTLGIAERAPQY